MSAGSTSSFLNPTALLPRLKTEPSQPVLEHCLQQLGIFYAPKIFQPDEDLPESTQDTVDRIRADQHERSYAVSWLMKLIGTDVLWLQEQGATDQDRDRIIDKAGQIIAADAQIDEADAEAITRDFTFPLDLSGGDHDKEQISGKVAVRLRDEPLPPSKNDPDPPEDAASDQAGPDNSQQDDRKQLKSYQAAAAVGVQTWAAAAFLSDWLIRDITKLHGSLDVSKCSTVSPLRIIELGAGTGLVGLAVAQHLATNRKDLNFEVCLTDFHEQVLDNLRYNVEENLPASDSTTQSASIRVHVKALDWEEIHTGGQWTSDQWWPSQKGSWSTILAADCVYSPSHATWLASTMAFLLAKPDVDPHARAIMIMANRTRGRFGEWELRRSVEEAFTPAPTATDSVGGPHLKIVHRTELPRVRGLGRDDEDGYVIWTFAFTD
ncbi:hypothetical protein OC846_001648 [Tilletia horrida]|uniref:Uncharacterized protein n=1 Tax=Tilletia horrida TaxID=155126 RepID=A0AAN6GTL6_9BASI|nr:hypothetical protein OC845_003012 [Tilletia horrida]KAK0555683.1 hypothetical protein OC846_001648 [Tilletia horrida]KAK0568585.1 hypothetical protein OC861_001833 [Tilletia horrida]